MVVSVDGKIVGKKTDTSPLSRPYPMLDDLLHAAIITGHACPTVLITIDGKLSFVLGGRPIHPFPIPLPPVTGIIQFGPVLLRSLVSALLISSLLVSSLLVAALLISRLWMPPSPLLWLLLLPLWRVAMVVFLLLP